MKKFVSTLRYVLNERYFTSIFPFISGLASGLFPLRFSLRNFISVSCLLFTCLF